MNSAKKLTPELPTMNLSPQEVKKLSEAIDQYYNHITDRKLSHFPITLDLIILHELPDVSLFLANGDRYKPFRKKGMYLSQAELDSLAQNNITHLYLEKSDIPVFTQYIEKLLDQLPSDSKIIDEQKVGLLRKSAIQVMSDIFDAPTPENIDRGVKVVSGFVYTLMRDPKAYEILLNLSSHDHYTLQHSVGVATNAIILAKKIGIQDEGSLIEVGVAGLLHDIGKTKVPREIINKQGPLDEAEWEIMRQHSLFGHEILKNNKNVGTKAKLAVLQHHEEPNGTGYPLKLAGSQIDLYAKIISLCDIYNAITTDRSYSKAKAPFEAFTLIRQKLSHKVDPKLFEALVHIYGGKIS